MGFGKLAAEVRPREEQQRVTILNQHNIYTLPTTFERFGMVFILLISQSIVFPDDRLLSGVLAAVADCKEHHTCRSGPRHTSR